MNSPVRRILVALGLTCLLCFAGGTIALAQPTQSAPALTDTIVAVVPPRSIEDIKRDSERASAQRQQTKQQLARAQEELSTLENMISLRKKDVSALEDYIDGLDADKQAKQIAAGKQTLAVLEKLLDLFKLRRSVREAEIESAEATIALTDAQDKLYSLEERLATKRDDRATIAKKPGAATELAVIDSAIKELEAKVFDLWEDAIGKQKDRASAEKDYLGQIKKLADAQDAFHNP